MQKIFYPFLALVVLTSACDLASPIPPTPTMAPCDAISEFFWASFDLAIAQDAHIWAVGDDGAWRLDPNNKTCALFTEENGLAGDSLSAVAVNTNGGEYGPYVIAPLTTDDDTGNTIYYTLSTWNPYNVMLMSSRISLTP
ncbi:MAG: DUF4185 domain-containing protein [Caldilineae bacterium]|nr:MAG: DUF4185 domain-containing protein [Caldilineae bacterium]